MPTRIRVLIHESVSQFTGSVRKPVSVNV